MTAALHFAEDSLALHFLLERLEGLIDIVVANEYLHGLSCILRPGLEDPKLTRIRGHRGAQVAGRLAERLFLVQSGCASAASVVVPLSQRS
jgi:hypothetical protein